MEEKQEKEMSQQLQDVRWHLSLCVLLIWWGKKNEQF